MADSQMERSPEEHLAGAARFMDANSITAVLVDGRLADDRWFEGLSFWQGEQDLGDVLFADGSSLEAPVEVHRLRLAVSGFVTEVVRPVQRAARFVYQEGSNLLDERFDVLPGFTESTTSS